MTAQHPPTFVFDVSGHGFGHLGQITPVIRELARRHPQARLVVRSPHPPARLKDFIGLAVESAEPPPEAILAMRGPNVVDAAASAEAFRALHADWTAHVRREAERLVALRPTILIADVPYLSLAAARRAGIPAVALCSLNWLDMYRTYCGDRPEAPAIVGAMSEAYRSAALFLQPAPHMPMADLPNRRAIGPLARIGRKRGDEIRNRLGLPAGTRLALVTFGGIPSEGPLTVPTLDGVHWLAAASHCALPPGVSDIAALGLPFIDVLASCAVVLTKVGYCTFVEAACNGAGIVTLPRPDWPETGPMVAWSRKHARFAVADSGLADQAGVAEALAAVLAMPDRPPVPPNGIAEAADAITTLIGTGST